MIKDVKAEIEKIRDFLVEYAKMAGADGYVLGISGGLDSSVLFKILESTDLNIVAIMMPINSMVDDEKDAKELISGTDKDILKIDLSSVYEEMLKVLPPSKHSLSYANIKPRLRMTTLYQVAQSRNLLVAGASNKSEYMTGYFTKHGDSGVDVLPLVDYYKHEIYEMGRFLNLPNNILKKPPSAGLFKGQTDEDEIGLSYDEIDSGLSDLENGNPKKNNKLLGMVLKSEHKRHVPKKYEREE